MAKMNAVVTTKPKVEEEAEVITEETNNNMEDILEFLDSLDQENEEL